MKNKKLPPKSKKCVKSRKFMVNPSIQLSRRGFGYQDKYSLFIFSKFLLDKNLKAFFVDKAFGDRGFSLDTLVIPRNTDDVEVVYEIKTGERFQERNEEIGHALKVLFYYQGQTRKECNFHLIVSPEFKVKLNRIWLELKHLHENRFLLLGSQRMSPQKIAEELRKELKLEKEFSDRKKFENFVKSIKRMDKGDPYEKDSELSEFGRLENQIIRQIDDLARILEVQNPGLNSRYLMMELLYDVQNGAENGDDIYPLAKKSIIEFFTQKSIIAKRISKPSLNVNILDKEEKKEIEKRFIEKLEGGVVEKEVKVSEVSEGEPISDK